MVTVTEQPDFVDLDVKVNKKQYDFLRHNRKRKKHLYGSAGSGKSWSIAQYLLIEKMLNEHDIRIIVVRKTGPALAKSAWLLIQDLLKKYDIPYDINKTDKVIFVGTNEMYFIPLDDPEKLKSIERINYVWSEEATELHKDDYRQLGLRCRGENPNGSNELIFSYNPVATPYNKYLQKISLNPPTNTAILHTTYHDNEFLDDDYIDEIEGLEEEDDVYWKIYGLGEWATAKNLIYNNWDITPIEQWGELTREITNIGYGLDFGYNAPSALIQVGICDRVPFENHIFLKELLYERKLTNTQLIGRLDELIPDRRYALVADCAQPERIEEILLDGFNVFPCSKGKSSVKIGIDRVKRFVIHVCGESINLIEEFSGYKWKEDFNDNPLDIPVDYNNHLMDALRYYLGELRYDGAPELVVVGNMFGD